MIDMPVESAYSTATGQSSVGTNRSGDMVRNKTNVTVLVGRFRNIRA